MVKPLKNLSKRISHQYRRFWLGLSLKGQRAVVLGIGFAACGITFWPVINHVLFPLSNVPADQRHLYQKENYFRGK